VNKTYARAEFQDLALEAGYANEFEYAKLVGYVYEKVPGLFRRRLEEREVQQQRAILRDMLDDFDDKDILVAYDAAGYAVRAAVRELTTAWDSHVAEGWPLQYLIYDDGLETVKALKRWLTALEEEVAAKEAESGC